jgi:hypothetical protein
VRAAVDGAHASLVEAFIDAILIGEDLSQQRIVSLFQTNAIRGTQRGCVRILVPAFRTFFHRAICCLVTVLFGRDVSLPHRFLAAKKEALRKKQRCERSNQATLASFVAPKAFLGLDEDDHKCEEH